MPKISVIIPLVNGMPTIADCLTAIERQICDFDFEIIVADRTKDGSHDYIRQHFPNVKLMTVDPSCGIPEMRLIAIGQASGEYLAITEDHCIAPDNWLAGIAAAHDQGYDVIGGAVENVSVRRLTDWAVFLCEYSSFVPPLRGGETPFITGNNTSYKRSLIENVDQDLLANYWEYFLHAELQRSGVKFLSVPSLIVGHKKEFGFSYFLSQRFHYSRSFAAMRKKKSTVGRQIFYLLSTPVLPFQLIWRIARNVQAKRRNYKEFILSLPLLLFFMGSYALGEFIGQLFGAGDSLREVE